VQPFYLNFSIPELRPEISHSKGLAFLGSCFSDEIAAKAEYCGFQTNANPFGTVFHPLALARFLSDCFYENTTERLDAINGRFISWDASSKFSEEARWGLLTKLTAKRQAFKSFLGSSSHLFITFGTAWGYVLNEEGLLVANCHKVPGNKFTKSLSESAELVNVWTSLIADLNRAFPNLTLVFTVSPVRHVRDGMVQNNQSKAVLLDAVRQLCAKTNALYFPSYEIVVDELRDYRFFKEDRVHPTNEAIEYVWNRFIAASCSSETKSNIEEIVAYRKLCGHISIHADETVKEAKMREKLASIRLKLPQFIG
jgi:hypothetical protein